MFTMALGEATALLTPDMLAPITETLTANLGVILPVGMGVMATIVGVSLIPKLLYKFF